MELKVTCALMVPASELSGIQAAATEAGLALGEPESVPLSDSTDLSTARFAGAVTVAGAITLAWIAKRMIDHWLRSKEQGVQIDTRSEPPIISTIANVPSGFIVIIAKDGTVTTQQGRYEKPEELTPILARAFGSV